MEKNAYNAKAIKDCFKDLKERIIEAGDKVSDDMSEHFDKKPKYIVFLSAGYPDQKAIVSKGMGNTLESGWKNAADVLNKRMKERGLTPAWLKADLVDSIQGYALEDFCRYAAQYKPGFLRKGMALDDMLNTAFLEQEVNANGMVWYNKDKRCWLDWQRINGYIKKNQGSKLQVDPHTVTEIFTFTTRGFFHDGKSCSTLLGDDRNNGRRPVNIMSREFIWSVIVQASEYLKNQVDAQGKFRYGYSAINNREINSYNIVRHAGTSYAMAEAYELTQDPELRKAVERALEYLVREGIEQIIDTEGIQRAYVIERKNNEVKLGANSAAILALTKYQSVFQDNKYADIAEELANGVQYFQQADGSFVHVLNYPDLSLKDQFRIIYYDGEAAFALLRLYEMNRNPQWLEIILRAFDHYIAQDYWKYHDHWLSYCSNEILKYRPNGKYVRFNLSNASGILKSCLEKLRTQPVLLELLMATYDMLEKLKVDNECQEIASDFDEASLIQAIAHRAEHQLNGFFFPEVAMYFDHPENLVGSFFVREDGFRVRIDDVQHNLSGYCCFYKGFLKGPIGAGEIDVLARISKPD